MDEDKVVDVRDTERAEILLLGVQGQFGKISHVMALKHCLEKTGEVPEGVDVIRPVEYPQ